MPQIEKNKVLKGLEKVEEQRLRKDNSNYRHHSLSPLMYLILFTGNKIIITNN